LRGDTDFSQTAHLDRWDAQGDVQFLFGMDATKKLTGIAEALPEAAWQKLDRPAKYAVKTAPRRRPENVKEQVVKEREFENMRLVSEDVAGFAYQPVACQQAYRVVVVRKNLSVEKAERVLFDDVRYFFYITNLRDLPAAEIVLLANDRCDQENLLAQLKGGVQALRMPVDNLVSNWAYMVMAGLAWNLKAWYGLLVPDRERGLELVRMEFRRFLHAIILLPVQIIRAGRRIVYRLLGYNGWMDDFFATFERLAAMAPG
jgi:hypothetical protein